MSTPLHSRVGGGVTRTRPFSVLVSKLARYAETCGFAIPAQFGEGAGGGSNLRRLDAALETSTRYAELTTGQRHAWRTVVKHNEHDLRATRHVLSVIASTTTTRRPKLDVNSQTGQRGRQA